MSAHTAIDRHARRQMVSAKRSNLLVAIAGLVVGGALLWMWWAMKTGDLTFYSAMVSSLVALFWGVRYAVLTGRLIVSKSGAKPHAAVSQNPRAALTSPKSRRW